MPRPSHALPRCLALTVLYAVSWAAAAACPEVPTTPLPADGRGDRLPLATIALDASGQASVAELLEQCFGLASREAPVAAASRWSAFRIDLDGNVRTSNWLASTTETGFSSVCIHWPIPAGRRRDCAGNGIPLRDHSIRHPRPTFPVPGDLVAATPILVEVVHPSGRPATLVLQPTLDFLGEELIARFDSGLFYGVLGVLAIVSLAGGIALRDRSLAWYGAHLGTFTLSFLGFSGQGSIRLGGVLGGWPEELSLALLAASFAAAAHFVRAFLATRREFPVVHRVLVMLELGALILVGGAFIVPALAYPLTALVVLGVVVVSLAAALRAALAGYRPALYLLVGAGAFGLTALAAALVNLRLLTLPGGAVFTLSQFAILLAGASMFAGLVHRTGVIRRERDVALENALAVHRIALHRANHDEVTGLINRSHALALGNEALAAAQVDGDPLTVLAIGLDDFPGLELSLPTAVTDRVLKLLAERITAAAPAGAIVARPAADGFLVFDRRTVDGNRQATATELADRIRRAISEPIVAGDRQLRLTATVGVALAPEHGSTFEALRSAAQRAVFLGRTRGGNLSLTFEKGQQERLVPQGLARGELAAAMASKQIAVHYQPVLAVADGEISGYEALVRWNHPERGLILPGEFLPQIDESSLMVELGRQVQDTVCAALAARRARGLAATRISINVAAVELRQPDFLEVLLDRLQHYEIDPGSIELELTESSLVRSMDEAARVLLACRNCGIETVVDDFGTGYSSLNYIRRLPLAGLKIDRSFVSRLDESPEDRTIVATIIELAHSLGLRVVAEGVATAGQRARLQRAGCDFLQGYLIGRPQAAPAEAGEDLLRTRSAR